MSLTRFGADGFRNLTPFEINPSLGINLIVGENGAGKTSLLEAIHFLSRGRSFRTNRLERIRQHGRSDFQVFGSASSSNGRVTTLGISKAGRDTIIRVAGNSVTRLSELARHLPVVSIGSESHRLVEDGPELRRRFLDWSVFHVEHADFSAWHIYEHALRQRNAAIRNKLPITQIRLWDAQLCEAGEKIDQARSALLKASNPYFLAAVTALFQTSELKLTYRSGWQVSHSGLQRTLERHIEDDIRRGFTQYGPHRAELQITSGGVDVRETLSRGQQKLLVTAMLVAQATYLCNVNGKRSIILYDDLPSELDVGKRHAVLDLLKQYTGQVFISAIRPDAVALPTDMDHSMFHVEQGRISQVI
ncbi:MAG: DNA replication/repair protein RecF [Gammaproteobacteria bacterium]|nr:DNA replication/repair protein RecF [Gammaproteobacteria bacterium]